MNITLLNEIDLYIKAKQYRLVNSIVVYENNRLVFERYYNGFTADSRNNIKSIWKSILSIGLGICLDKGLIKNLDDPIRFYLPEFDQNIHPYHKLISIRSLLTMTSGIYWNAGRRYHCPMMEQLWQSKDWIAYLADIPMAHVPNRFYEYKEWDVILLSAVIGKVSGMNSYEFCENYLYAPLAIQSKAWAQSPCGVCYTVIPSLEEYSDLSARDLAKIGILFLNGGVYDEKRILSQQYVEQAVSPGIVNQGYGYLWWIHENGYSCRGYGGQEVNVLPDKNLVAVIQAHPTARSKAYTDIYTEYIVKAAE